MNQNENQMNNLSFLDLLSLISFFSQVENMKKDSIETNITHSFIQAVAKEIELLHKENGRIEQKLDKLLNNILDK